MVNQRTLQREVALSGVGIHSGKKVNLVLRPSRSGRILFRRLDLDGLEVALEAQKIQGQNCSFLRSEGCTIQTLEHILAVFYILGIDSLEIDLDGGEIPILDGSAAPYVEACLEAGLSPLPNEKKVARIVKNGTIASKEGRFSFYPDRDFRVTYTIDFPHPLIGRQELSLPVTRKDFIQGVAPARTFGFLKDVPELRKRGLALGGSLANALVLDDEKVVNGPLRYEDEFVRHKILDLIGDLSLFDRPFLGHFKADRAGHNLHLKVVHFLLENPDYWVDEEKEVPRYLVS